MVTESWTETNFIILDFPIFQIHCSLIFPFLVKIIQNFSFVQIWVIIKYFIILFQLSPIKYKIEF